MSTALTRSCKRALFEGASDGFVLNERRIRRSRRWMMVDEGESGIAASRW